MAQLGVEIRQGLVEQEAAGANDERARQGHPLLFATGELIDPALGVTPHTNGFENATDLLVDLVPRDAAFTQPEYHVFRDVEVRPERKTLEDHPRISAVGGEAGHFFVAEKHRPPVGHDESCNRPQQRRFAAAARPHQEKELPRLDLEIDIVERHRIPKGEADLAEGYGHHEREAAYVRAFRPASLALVS